MHAIAAAGASFLLAVLWFDLMFDVQTRGHSAPTLPPEVLQSISAYYKRVTIDASPMGRIVSAAMLVTVGAIVADLVIGPQPAWRTWASLVLASSAVALALARTVRNAQRLGRAADSAEAQSQLARLLYRDHQYCFAAMLLVLVLQLAGGS